MLLSERARSYGYSSFPHHSLKQPQAHNDLCSTPSLPINTETPPSPDKELEISDKSYTQTSDQENWSSSDASDCAQRSSHASLSPRNSLSSHQQNSPRRGKPRLKSRKMACSTKPTNCLSSDQIGREEIFKVVREVQAYSAHVLKQLLCKDSEILLLERQIKASDENGYRRLQAQLCDLQASLSCKTTEYIKLRQQNAELRTCTKGLLETNEQLTTNLSDRDDELISLKHRKEELKKRLLHQKINKERLNSTITRLREQISQLQTEAREFKADKAVKLDLGFALDEREREQRRAYEKVEYLNNVIRKYQERNQDLAVENKKMMSKVAQQLKMAKVAPVEEKKSLTNKNSHHSKEIHSFRAGTKAKQNNTTPAIPSKPKPFSLFGVRSGGPSYKKGDSEVSNWMPFNSRVVDLAKILDTETQ